VTTVVLFDVNQVLLDLGAPDPARSSTNWRSSPTLIVENAGAFADRLPKAAVER
jgi:hypothetical protein